MTGYQYQQVRARDVNLICGDAPQPNAHPNKPPVCPVIIHGDGGLLVPCGT